MKHATSHSQVFHRAAAVLLVLCLVSGAWAERYGDIEITRQAVAEGATEHGYAEYVFTVTNRSPRDHDVTLRLPGSGGGRADHLYLISATQRIEANGTARIHLFQPPLPMYGAQVRVAIDGQTQRDAMSVGSIDHMQQFRWGGHGAAGGMADFSVLLSRSINRSNMQTRFDDVLGGKPTGGGYSPFSRDYIQNELPVEAWSQRWLAYSRFDAIVLTGEELDAMPPAVRDALMAYVEAGGTLVVAGPWQAPAAWRKQSNSQPGHYRGFGRVVSVASTNPEQWGAADVRLIGNEAVNTNRPFERRRSVQAANSAFSVVDNLGVPVRGLFALMLLFAILMGPVNLVLLSRRKRRMWLLWTVPALSLAACGAVFTYNVFAEGWTIHSRTQLFTILDQNTHRAVSLGWCAFYAPLAPGDGLHFAYETELTPQVHNNRYNGGGTARSVDWTRDQHLATGWITSRIPAHFMVRKVGPQRQRIQITRSADGRLTATNGLTVDVRDLYYAGPNGKLHHAAALPAGKKTPLAVDPSHRKIGQAPDDALRRIYAGDWIDVLDPEQVRDMVHRGRLLRYGDYMAVLDGAPFLEDPLAGDVPRGEPSFLYGIGAEATILGAP